MNDGLHNAGSEFADGVIEKGASDEAGAYVILTKIVI